MRACMHGMLGLYARMHALIPACGHACMACMGCLQMLIVWFASVCQIRYPVRRHPCRRPWRICRQQIPCGGHDDAAVALCRHHWPHVHQGYVIPTPHVFLFAVRVWMKRQQSGSETLDFKDWVCGRETQLSDNHIRSQHTHTPNHAHSNTRTPSTTHQRYRPPTLSTDMFNRLAVFHAAGLLMGINLGPLLAQVAFNRPDIIITALTGCNIYT